MNITILAAGAGGMYCGSCMRDNALAAAMKRRGHDVTLIPLYTPLRTDGPDVSLHRVFYGGINVYLQHLTRLFRHTPRLFDWIFDRPWLLNLAGKWGAQTPPEKLAGLTASVLEGEQGPAHKELHRLIAFLKTEIKPQIVTLPNLMFAGMASAFRSALNVPVVCELTGEDIFLDAMDEADRARVRGIIREQARHVSRFVATSDDYASRMAEYLGLPRGQIDVVPSGLSPEYLSPMAQRRPREGRAPVVGYLARICPEKGLDRLVDALLLLRQKPGLADARLTAAGYLGLRDQKWFDALKRRIDASPLREAFTYLGEVTREQKLGMLDSIDVFSVPTAYPEAKGIYVLEALARGVPVVQPAHGSFPELIAQTGGGILAPPGDAAALADALAELLQNSVRAAELGRAGRIAIESTFTEDQMAGKMLAIYEELTMRPRPTPTDTAVASSADSAAGPGDRLLVATDLRKQYPTPGQPLVVLNGVSFSLASGDALAVVGPSGSGKSTLLNILGTLDDPTSGTVRLGGVDPFSLKPAQLARFRSERIGFIFQEHHLLPQCTALENVLVARLAAGPVRPQDTQRAADLLRQVGLEDRARHLPAELSGGERQRVAIARALMNGPDLLLCDEPTGSLDAHTGSTVADLLFSIAGETGIILIGVTHSAAFADRFPRKMRMREGELVEEGAAGAPSPSRSFPPSRLATSVLSPSPSGRGLP